MTIKAALGEHDDAWQEMKPRYPACLNKQRPIPEKQQRHLFAWCIKEEAADGIAASPAPSC